MLVVILKAYKQQQKSINDCIQTQIIPQCKTSFFPLQVALGECVELPSGGGRGPSGSHSARLPGRWTPDPRAHISWQSWTVPLGETTLTQVAPTSAGCHSNSAHLAREVNEFVVYKPQQVCMRYLVEYH